MIQDPFLKRLLHGAIAFSIFAALVGSLAWAVVYKPYGVPDVRLGEWKEIQARVEQRKKDLVLAAETSRYPKVQVMGDSTYDFSSVPPHASVSHDFKIINEGTAPLRLQAGDTSCKCTLSTVGTEWLEPGDSTKVTLTFNAGKKADYYRQYAIIYTNDPDQHELELVVTGRVQAILASDQQELVFSDLSPSSVAKRELHLYSQVWDDFEIGTVKTGLEGTSWVIRPLENSKLEELEAKCGWVVDISVDSSKQTPYFADVLRVEVQNIEIDEKLQAQIDTKPEEITSDEEVDGNSSLPQNLLEISLRGNLARPLSLYGPMVDRQLGISFGSVVKGKGAELNILMKVRAEQAPLDLKIASIRPDFIQGEILESNRANFWRLRLIVPEHAPEIVFDGDMAGEIVISSEILPGGQLKVPIRGVVSKLGK
jgi:hypothetical protein